MATTIAGRKAAYKLPPTTITDQLVSQEARRINALKEQKRRRAQRVDSARHLDRFAEMTLGMSDDDAEEAEEEDPQVAPGSVAQYAAMLAQEVDPGAIENHVLAPVPSLSPHHLSPPPPHEAATTPAKKKKKRRKARRQNKWADRCMYAELLEMAIAPQEWEDADGLPLDLETGWVAVGPVPVGKRCLAITQTAAGATMAPNTTLRSRILGKVLLHRFPSPLPPLTILDCILDARWRENGILHVLDVIKWKGQDVADCESAFRRVLSIFWWRDTRLTELVHPTAPPPPQPGQEQEDPPGMYRFPYPTALLPVPYHTDTSLPALLAHVVPAARAPRLVQVCLPLPVPAQPFVVGEGMDVDAGTFEFGQQVRAQTRTQVQVEPDGLLLYVKEAAYEPGTSPLSSWIPIAQEEEKGEGRLDLFERSVTGL
ncbi:hypothetical protein D9615_006166 [Tricholomella constricta]|uniref:Snurportin-1 n=1 Tax=Tricholomella constricta TaxID=117010 RepID=A0A8H5HB13_9AGAR|nr:hypothetical protein D9615_006166 [Tricholomella constricta]